jgi:hypothetical protein
MLSLERYLNLTRPPGRGREVIPFQLIDVPTMKMPLFPVIALSLTHITSSNCRRGLSYSLPVA